MILRSRRLPAVHMEDAIQQVKIKAFESTIGNHPTTIDGWQKVCRPISNSVAVDAYRSPVAAVASRSGNAQHD